MYLGQKGLTIPKSTITESAQKKIKKDLTIFPKSLFHLASTSAATVVYAVPKCGFAAPMSGH